MRLNSVLVTGANGMMGRALIDQLALKGFRVNAAARRMADWPSSVQFLEVGDLSRPWDWNSALKGVESVVHCAAHVHLKKGASGTLLDDYRRVNVVATMNLAQQAADSGARRFVFISSIGVNGGVTVDTPFRAEDAVAPHSPYAVSKREAEVGLKEMSERTGLEVVIIRPPLIIGPGARGNFGRLLQAAYRGIPLPLDSIRNRRSVVALHNLVDLIITCLHHPKAANEIFLVRDAEELSTAALFKMTGAALGRPARLLPVPPVLLRAAGYLTGNGELVRQLCGSLRVDTSKTRELLNWSPVITTRAALQEAADHFLANLAAQRRKGLSRLR